MPPGTSRIPADIRLKILLSDDPVPVLVERFGVSKQAIYRIRERGLSERDRKTIEAQERARPKTLPQRHYVPSWA